MPIFVRLLFLGVMSGFREIFRQSFSLILPFTALVIVPLLIEDRFDPAPLPPAMAGLACIALGLGVMVATIRMFILIGRGTLAPWSPTRRLVVRGLYARVRNPMILGVLTVLLGESLLFASVAIALWAAAFFLINTIYFIFSEEPGLERRFGEEYREYKNHVPRWIPRRKSWRPENGGKPE